MSLVGSQYSTCLGYLADEFGWESVFYVFRISC